MKMENVLITAALGLGGYALFAGIRNSRRASAGDPGAMLPFPFPWSRALGAAQPIPRPSAPPPAAIPFFLREPAGVTIDMQRVNVNEGLVPMPQFRL